MIHTFLTTVLAILFFHFSAISQNCLVEKKELQGSYTGDCRKGRAHGKGKAAGTDQYEGDFIAGWPDGKGTYTWANGNQYTGEWTKGKREGMGLYRIKQAGMADSVVQGYWHEDQYTGFTEKPFRLIFKSKQVDEVDIQYKDAHFPRVVIVVTNTSGGANTVEGDELPRLKVDEVVVIKGAYGRLFVNDVHAKKTESLIEEISFPIRFRALIGSEELELEFTQKGNYLVNVRINQ
jgi:hypothetical protein